MRSVVWHRGCGPSLRRQVFKHNQPPFSEWTSRRWQISTTQSSLSPHASTEITAYPTVGQDSSTYSSTKATGLLYNLPHVVTSEELVSSANKRAKRLGRNKKLVGPAVQARNLAARQMDTLMKGLATPLTGYLSRFPTMNKLHPFEAALLDLTITKKRYEHVLAKVLQLRKSATSMGKDYASRGAKAQNKKEAERIAEEGFSALESLFVKHGSVLTDLVDVARKLRQLPKLELGMPTLALVGAPNVGKSSLVHAISSGRPEICNYPFTTRSIKMGHFYVDSRRHQVTDTPGLLNRPDNERNALELLTVATLKFLPTAVVFVMDITEECGTSIEDQFAIRSQLKETFSSKLWFDAFSKVDLLADAIEAADRHLPSQTDEGLPKAVWALRTLPEAARVSCMTEEGMENFKQNVVQLFSASAESNIDHHFNP